MYDAAFGPFAPSFAKQFAGHNPRRRRPTLMFAPTVVAQGDRPTAEISPVTGRAMPTEM
jgi:hypothetical protein